MLYLLFLHLSSTDLLLAVPHLLLPYLNKLLCSICENCGQSEISSDMSILRKANIFIHFKNIINYFHIHYKITGEHALT